MRIGRAIADLSQSEIELQAHTLMHCLILNPKRVRGTLAQAVDLLLNTGKGRC